MATIFSVFDPKRKHLVTGILIGLNTLVFIIMVVNGVGLFEPKTESLLRWGAVFRPAVLAGEWWRLITCCFIHVGLFHLMVNMYALLYIGIMLEPLLGRVKFLVAYLLTGLLASLASISWNVYTVGAGASGAIFGVYGLFLALLTTHLIHPQVRKPLLKSMVWFVVLNLAIGLSGFVDSAAHGGGLVSGFLLGYAYLPALKHPGSRGLFFRTIVLSIAGVLLVAVTVYRLIPRDILVYEQKTQAFESRDSLARGAYDQLVNGPADQRERIKEKAVQYWRLNEQLVTEMNALRVPKELRDRNRRLQAYCRLREQQIELTYEAITQYPNPMASPYKDRLDLNKRELDTLEKSFEEGE